MDTQIKYPENFRQEVLSKIFSYIQSGESFYAVGAASVGKTRLLDYLMIPDSKEKYLPKDAKNKTYIIRVDLNRLITKNNSTFIFCELILSSLLLEFSKYQGETFEALQLELASLDSQIIQKRDDLLSLRFLELAISKLCQYYRYKLCFILDEFDEAMKNFPHETFSQLRAIRDANKYNVCYALFLRNVPETLRNIGDIESFYELLSRNLVGIGPYTLNDTYDVIHKIESRHQHNFQPDIRKWLALISGGHPGIVQALFSILLNNSEAFNHLSNLEWFARQELVIEECHKIWNGLSDDEKTGIKNIICNNSIPPEKIKNYLSAKGLIQKRDNTYQIFSPIFDIYLQEKAQSASQQE